MEIKIVGEDGQVKEEAKAISSDGPEVSLAEPLNLDLLSLAQMFEMSPGETKESEEKLETLIKWAKTQTDKPTRENLKWAIRNLESRVGSPPMGESIINKIHRFAFLELEEQRIRSEKESMYAN